jgi:hypothetical protein
MGTFVGRVETGFKNIRYTKSTGTVPYAEPVDTSAPSFVRDLASGTGANQANIYYREERTITTGGSFVLDLNGTSNQDIFGQNLAMTAVVGIHVITAPADDSAAANTTNVTITTTLANIFGGTTPSVIMAPGESFQRANAGASGLCAVTPTTADTITFTNASGASAKVQIAVIGRG